MDLPFLHNQSSSSDSSPQKYVSRGFRELLSERGLFVPRMTVKEAKSAFCSQGDIAADPLRFSLARKLSLRKGRKCVTSKPPGSGTVFQRSDGTTVSQDLF